MDTYNWIVCKIDFIVSKPEPQKDPNEPNRKVPSKLGEWKGIATFAPSVDNFKIAKMNLQKAEVRGVYRGVDVFGDAIPTVFDEKKMTIEFVGSGALYGVPLKKQEKGGDIMLKVEFKFEITQRVRTPFNEIGIVDMLAFDIGGKQYYVKTKSTNTWFREDELESE